MMTLSAVSVFCFLAILVTVQATCTSKDLEEITVELSGDTILELYCTGTRTSTPHVDINGIPVASSNATELLASLGVEESVLRDSARRLVLYFRLNVTSEALVTVVCNGSGNYCYKFKLTDVQVHHPPPENVTGKCSSENSSAIQLQWNSPYSTLNEYYHKILHVEPHIMHYTVDIMDVCTGTVVVVNTMERGLTLNNAPDDTSCLIYKVSTWNDGGEGEPVLGNLHHDCQRSANTSTTSSPATATTVTISTTNTGTNTNSTSTNGDTTATSGGDQQRNSTIIIIATFVGVLAASLLAVVMTIAVIFLCNRKVFLLEKCDQSACRSVIKETVTSSVL